MTHRKIKSILNHTIFRCCATVYEQVAPKGLNHILRVYDVSFSGTEERIKQIDEFLERHGGYKSFSWTPHKSTQGKFRCNEWNATYQEGFGNLSAQFREVVA